MKLKFQCGVSISLGVKRLSMNNVTHLVVACCEALSKGMCKRKSGRDPILRILRMEDLMMFLSENIEYTP